MRLLAAIVFAAGMASAQTPLTLQPAFVTTSPVTANLLFGYLATGADSGSVIVSRDGGATWSPAYLLPQGRL